MEKYRGEMPSYDDWRAKQESPKLPHEAIRDELVELSQESLDPLTREVVEKLILMMDAKDRAYNLAQYIATADPKDITTYYKDKKLGIFLVCDTVAKISYQVGDQEIKAGDRLLEIHIPPIPKREYEAFTLLQEIKESFQLTSEYIAYHQLTPRYIYGCTYDPLVSLLEKRGGFKAVRFNIPEEIEQPVRRVFRHYVDPVREPKIGFIYLQLEDFQQSFS
jgi:hypothetical protein